MPDFGQPDYGDAKSVDNWNSDLSPHGLRDGHDDETYSDDPIKLPKDQFAPAVVEHMHRHSDVDSATYSQHHTLGPRHTQSSPGDHIHDGGTSKNLTAHQGFNGAANNYGWMSTGTAPAIGNGVVDARYLKLGGNLCRVSYILIFGTTTTLGTGNWTFALPFPARIPPSNVGPAVGVASAFMNGPFRTGIAFISDANHISIITDNQTAYWGPANPQAWGSSSSYFFEVSAIYETA